MKFNDPIALVGVIGCIIALSIAVSALDALIFG